MIATHLSRALCALACLAGGALPAELLVPQQFPTIQDALDAASPGDTVRVGSGVYRERLQLDTADVLLRGQDTTLDAEFGGPCVSIAADGVSVTGFTLLDGGDPAGVADALHATGTGLTLSALSVRSCAGTGLWVSGDGAVIEDNELSGCLGTAIRVVAELTTSVTVIRGNTIAACATGIVAQQGQLQVEGNRLSAVSGTGLDLDPANFVSASSIAAQVRHNRLVQIGGLAIDVDLSVSGIVGLVRNVLEDVGGGIDVQSTGGGDVDVISNRVSDVAGDAIKVRASGPVFAGRNQLCRSGARGLVVEATGTKGGLLERNLVRASRSHGIQVTGRSVVVRQNRISDVTSVGIAYVGNTGTLLRNQVRDAGRQGLLLSGNDGLIERNLVRGCVRDGLLFSGSRNDVLDNRFQDNAGDGIDLAELGFFHDDRDNLIARNVCTGNAHEGIDNSGLDTLIEDNTLGGNGGAFGPEIAGAGNDVDGDDVADGTVASFVGNTLPPAQGDHLPGGATTAQRLDLGELLP